MPHTERRRGAAETAEIWLFDADGSDLGFVALAAARVLARERGLDLLGPEGRSSPPRFQLGHAGQIEAVAARATRLSRSERSMPKEIRVRVATGTADLETRRRSAASLLEAGHRVKIRVELDPARRRDPAPARAVLDDLVKRLAPAGAPESKPQSEKGAVAVVLAPR